MDMHFTVLDDKTSAWAPPDAALSLDAFGNGANGRRPVVMASHPSAPFIGKTGVGDFDQAGLQRIAHAYLGAVADRFDARFKDRFPERDKNFLPPGWLGALDPDQAPPEFGWLDLGFEGRDELTAPATSRVTWRGDDPVIILVAGDPYPSGFGVRIVMRVLDTAEGLVAVNGMTAHLPYAPYRTWRAEDRTGVAILRDPRAFFETHWPLLEKTARQQDVSIHELRLLERPAPAGDPAISLDVVTYGTRAPLGRTDSIPQQSATATLTRWSANDPESPELIAECPLQADAMTGGGGGPVTVTVPVFEDDPVSDTDVQDPPPYVFGAYRPTGLLEPARDMIEITSPLQTGDFIVRNCPDFVAQDAGKDPTAARDIVLAPGELPDPRSEDQSAISAYYACFWFFEQIASFGVDTAALFRRVNRPLQVHYRSGIRPGPGKDGRTINARVEIRDPPAAGFFPPASGSVHMHLALANLTKWFRDVPETGAFAPRAAQPLGIANSRRWIHHELGHVLIAAALGELEFRFVHSIGDGLAAILADPTSRINEAHQTGPWAEFRFQTFPWVFSTRRHDRSVLAGWSWSGTMHRDVLTTPELDLCRLKGYNSEQILSTTLFRLYRSLGGDTVRPDGAPDAPARRRASLVVLYLLVRAVDSFAHPPLRAEELEGAMIDVDLALGTLPSTVGNIWTGGQAHKAIRWAFEAQGLHPADETRVNNGPGAAPPVDLYIKDRRSGIERTVAGDIDHGDGTYLPVSLHWAADAGWVGDLGDGAVVIGNRGSAPAPTLDLRGWVGLHFGGDIIWLPAFSFQDNIPGPLESGATVTFDPAPADMFPELADVLLLLEVSAPEDRANTDPAAALASAIAVGGQPPASRDAVMHRVANDNNLGLFWLRAAGR